LDVSQAFPIRELSEAQAQTLIPTRESTIAGITAIAAYTLLKFVGWRMSHQLRENRSANVHGPLSAPGCSSNFLFETPRNELQIEKCCNAA
jgi:hypothetical protein